MPRKLNLSQVLRRRISPPEIDTAPTAVRGVGLRQERGKRLKITAAALGELVVAAEEYAALDSSKKRAAEAQKRSDAALKLAALAHRGFRGLEHGPENFRLTVTPRYGITWKPALKAALGERYSAVVSEDVTASVLVPPTLETDQGPFTSEQVAAGLVNGLASIGIDTETARQLVGVETVLRIDETKLNELVEGGLALPASAGEISESWAIKVDPLRQA